MVCGHICNHDGNLKLIVLEKTNTQPVNGGSCISSVCGSTLLYSALSGCLVSAAAGSWCVPEQQRKVFGLLASACIGLRQEDADTFSPSHQTRKQQVMLNRAMNLIQISILMRLQRF